MSRGPVKTTEVREMRALAERGLTETQIARRLQRDRGTVSKYCADVLHRKIGRRSPAEVVKAWAETPADKREDLAEQYGYASAQSMFVIVWRARKQQSEARA